MTNTKPQKKPTDLRRKPPARTANNAQAREAARVQKKAAHGRGRQVAIGANDENDDSAVSSKPNRRSSRLNCMERGVTEGGGDLSTSAKPKVGRPTGTASSKRRGMATLGASRILRTPTPENEDAQSDGSVSLDEIYDLQRQLQEEKEKNRLLRRAGTAQASHVPKMIPKPKGSVGAAGFSLIAAMRLDKYNPKDKALYNDILASVRTLAISAGIDPGRRYRDQSIIKLSKLMLAAREAEPYLAMFEDDWATGQILRQYINGKRKYEHVKANGVAEVRKRNDKGTTRLPSPIDDEIEETMLNENSADNSEDESEWAGLSATGWSGA